MASDESKKSKDETADAKVPPLGEALKKVLTAGVSAAFMTEESIRSYLGELKLPKDVLNLLIQGASKSKDEITQKVSKEAIAMIQKIDWTKELSKFAEDHTFKISMEIDIKKKNKSE